ncbi:SHOCT domain-containing protein [Streptomyces sp. NBC_00878]|uniref:SHOCT domain-containing protein n=1 Tax=Streptomyces sp. NBC_00878 TaxID=2975854 RepID=UPI0022592777|nr:SHOCT domain-containing protein [Streptomyces sp. NBC_00878]MCX4904015.1 SHOCT domain-containing protein [Streptomyces sp. NBC_00878]
MSGWDWFAMSISTVLLWALFITVAVLLFRTLNRAPETLNRTPEHTHTPAAPSPEQLLAQRFARGEIDEEEYRRRLAVLRADGPSLTKQ